MIGVFDDTIEENRTLGALGKSTSGKHLKIRTYPTFSSPEEHRLYRKQHLAAAFRIIADRGFDEGIAGHISVRDPILTDHFWLNPLSQHFATICESDLILVNEDGDVVIGDEPINAAAFAIHSEIHKARPDVQAACHAQSVYGKAFAVFGKELDMMTQDSLRFYKSHAVYDNFGGVVLDREESKRIAKNLGNNNKAVILQNHGLLTVGRSVDEAAFWFIRALSVLKAIEACWTACIADLRWGKQPDRPVRISLERSARYLLGSYLFSIGGFTKIDPDVKSFLKGTDLKKAQSILYRRFSSNLYATKRPGEYFHLHGSLDATTALQMIGMEPFRPDLTEYRDCIEAIETQMKTFTCEEL